MTVYSSSERRVMAAHHPLPPQLDEDLDGALALTTITFNLGRTLGPAIAGIVIVSFGPATAFAANAASFLLFALALLSIRLDKAAAKTSTSPSAWDGFRFVRGEAVLIVLLVGVAALGFAQDPVNTLAPAIADMLGGGNTLVGLLVGAFGLGSVLAVTLGGRLRAAIPRRAAAVGGLFTLGTGMALLAVSPLPSIAVGSLMIAGMGFLFAITALMAGIYARVPEEFRGRVLALWGVAFLGSRPIAGIVDGAVADLINPRVAVALCSLVALGAAILVRTKWPHESELVAAGDATQK